MKTYRYVLNQLLAESLSSVSGENVEDAHVITASRPEFGDYQANGVMALAKRLKTNPRELAGKVVARLDDQLPVEIARLEVAGPGFINIFLSASDLCRRGNEVLNAPDTLIPATDTPQTIVVDYSSPNLAKEMHVGHLRGTIIGDSLVRVLSRLGHRVIRQNHVGDWGTQFGMLIAFLQELRDEQGDPGAELANLEVFYRRAKERFDSDPEFATTARTSVVKLQQGEPEYLLAWKQFIEESLQHCEAVYERLGVTMTRADLDAESRYNDALPVIVDLLQQRGLLSESDGARCVFLPEFKGKNDEPLPLIVQKSDGGYLYSTTDLAAIQFRSQQLAAERSLYVVDARQSLHFQQVFAVARRAEIAPKNLELEHISYGTIMGSDGRPFKTRSGDTIKLVDLLDEAQRRAHQLVDEKNPDLDADRRMEVAHKVGIGAVKYADLSKNRTSDYVFDWSSMLSFEGNTAPYLLYAYARIRSILRKADQDTNDRRIKAITRPEERNLLIKALQLPEIVQAVGADCYPNQLCNFLYELAGTFMRFYESCPILKAEGEARGTRLALASLAAETLAQGLDLLGIETLEQM